MSHLKVSLPEIEAVPPYSPQHRLSTLAVYQDGNDEQQPLTSQDAETTPSHAPIQMMVTPAVSSISLK